MDSHRAAFVAEAEDGVTDLNNALLALEADPEDAEAMDDVFRVAHTLKGNAAAMGYEDVSDFGHALEDLLDAVRQGDREVTPELMDLLFEGVDAVEAMVEEIADTGDVSTDPSDLESRLREMEERGTVGGGDDGDDAEDETEADDSADADAADGEPADDDAADDDAAEGAPDVEVPEPPADAADLPEPVAYADVTIGDAQMPGVDAALVLQALDEQFDDHVTDPAPEALEEGEYDGSFDAFVGGDDPEIVAEGLRALTQVEAAAAVAVGGEDAAEPTDPDAEAADSEPAEAETEPDDAEPDDAEPDDADSTEDDADSTEDDADSTEETPTRRKTTPTRRKTTPTRRKTTPETRPSPPRRTRTKRPRSPTTKATPGPPGAPIRSPATRSSRSASTSTRSTSCTGSSSSW